jgi:hypothetical protein
MNLYTVYGINEEVVENLEYNHAGYVKFAGSGCLYTEGCVKSSDPLLETHVLYYTKFRKRTI